jgi:hypothetical protein
MASELHIAVVEVKTVSAIHLTLHLLVFTATTMIYHIAKLTKIEE